MKTIGSKCVVFAGLALALGGCGGDGNHVLTEEINLAPPWLGAVSSTSYDGDSDDLLTAGLGKSGLAGAAPAFADPDHPTAAELRRGAIYSNYRAVLDINANSGYGSLYGPNVDARGNSTASEGKVAGTEYRSYADDGSGTRNVTLLVQVPASFDADNNRCIVTATSSGSRGIYGAIGSAGEWALKNHCAVAYTDKGSGVGLYTFDDDSVNLQNGLRSTRLAAGAASNFTPVLSDAERRTFAAAYPGRLAFKHAFSQVNPEQDWGRNTLQAIEFAYYVLNERYGAVARDGRRHLRRLAPGNTMVIASSISNGAGSALRAAEQDSGGLISAIAASEPQVQPASASGYSVRQGALAVATPGRALLDYSTFAALYQPCLAHAGRCTALVAKGLLSGATLAAQQADALARLHAYGWLTDSDVLQAAHATTNILVAVTYANAYGRFSVTDRLCGFTFAAVDGEGRPIALTSAQKTGSFATQSGIVGSVIYEDSVGGAKVYTSGISPSTGLADQSLDGFLCLRALATGVDPVTTAPPDAATAALSRRVRAGMAEVAAHGNLGGRPAMIVQGRSDTLIPVNDASRAYLGLNAAVEGSSSKLRYVEVTHANHFDSFSSTLPTAIVPLHVYLMRALDLVYANLKSGAALPPSQVVHTVARANADTVIGVANVPPIAAAPAASDLITITGHTVAVPD